MNALSLGVLVSAALIAPGAGQQAPWTPGQQIAAAVLPLPEVMRAGAAVLGYSPDLTLVTLRQGSNGMVCVGPRPGAAEFDARCYHQSFMSVVIRLRALHAQGVSQDEINRIVDGEVKAGKLTLPDHPTTGYRMLGPMAAYRTDTNMAGQAIESWQSVHFPYRTAAELGLPEEGQVRRTLPYVMSSGTFWSHVMIEHEAPAAGR